MNMMMVGFRRVLLFAAVLMLAAAGVFLLQNTEPVDVSFLLWNLSLSKGVLVFAAFGFGLLAGLASGLGAWLILKK